MTKPTDDLEAVRAVAEALQGFDAKDQERIIRWAREKLGHAPSPAVQLPAGREPGPPPPARDIPAPAATPKLQNLRTFERPEARRPEVEQPEVEQLEIEQFEVERPDPAQYETDQVDEEQLVEEPRGRPPAAVNIMMPPPEHKNRAPMVIGIILLTVAIIFLIVMIVTRAK